MEQDEIMSEVRAIREALAQRFNFDVEAIFLDAKKREGQGGRQVVHLEPRLVDPNPAGSSTVEGPLAEERRNS